MNSVQIDCLHIVFTNLGFISSFILSYPQSNGRAEAAVKTAKCIIQENPASNGSLNTDRVAKAIMQYCNTPLPGMSRSPTKILFHRMLHDFTPANPKH